MCAFTACEQSLSVTWFVQLLRHDDLIQTAVFVLNFNLTYAAIFDISINFSALVDGMRMFE